MDSKTEILIGMGAAVAAKCQNCLKFFISLARKNNIDENEIKQVIKIGKRVGLSSIKNMDKFISNSLNFSAEIQNFDNSEPCGCS
ncbi:MAG: carboxymuconolactone decarboxylase family protein [Promethearchaeota archaeon]